MKEKTAEYSDKGCALKIFLLTIAANGLMFLCDGHYMDDWRMYYSYFSGNSMWEKVMFSEHGQVYSHHFHEWIFMHFQKEYMFIAYRLMEFSSIFLANLMIYKIMGESRLFSRFEKISVLLFHACFLTMKSLIYSIDCPYMISYGIFLTGSYLAIKNIEKRSLAITVFSIVLFSISIIPTGSIYAFYYGFFIAYFYLSRGKKSAENAGNGNLYLSVVYLSLPFVIFFLNKLIFPTHGKATGYNSIDLTGKTLLFFARFIYAISVDIIEPLRNYIQKPLMFIGLIAVFSAFFLIGRRRFIINPENGAKLFKFSLVLFCLGMLPYAFVGAFPLIGDTNTSRYTMLLSLPVALIFISILKMSHDGAGGPVRYASFMIMSLLIFSFFIARNQNYISLEARWIKDQSIISNLRDNREAEKYRMFWIRDRYKLGGVRTYWMATEWKGMFFAAWNDFKWIGINVEPDGNNFAAYSRLENENRIPPEAEQAILEIDKAGHSRETAIVMHYWFLKLFRKKDLDEYVKNIVSLKLVTDPRDVNDINTEEQVFLKRKKEGTGF